MENVQDDKEIFFGVLGVFLMFFVMIPLYMGLNVFQKNLEGFFYAQISQPLQQMALVDVQARPEKPPLNLEANSAFSMKIYKYGKEKVLFRQDIDKVLPIASLTKLMTGLIVVENTPQNDYDFSRVVTVSSEAAGRDNVPVYGNLKEGESFTIKKLLDMMMLYSSNDAAFTLAEVIGKDNFVLKMNQQAKILGLDNTLFINPTGLDPEDRNSIYNHSTANELAALTKYILNNYPALLDLSLQEGPYPTQNGLADLTAPDGFKFIGGKTGYTDPAGGCMLTIMKDSSGNLFINVILGTDSPHQRIQEMQKMLNWVASI
jgi:D-alanyl-D-alanine carboxypeptidase (penicillin-binding protein 5/6)